MNGLILDVIVVVIALLFIIFGIWRGMYKLIYGLISSLAAIVLAVVLASTVTSFVINRTSLDEMLYKAMDDKIQGVIPAELEASSVNITYAWDDEGTMTVSIESGSDTYETVKDYIAGKSATYSTIFSIVDIDNIINSESTIAIVGENTESGTTFTTTLARVMSAATIVYILLAAVFIVLWILLYIVVRLIMLLIKKIVRGTYVGHFLDKLLGMAIGAAFAMVIIWGALAIIRLLGAYTWIIPVNELINASTLTKYLYENNILYNFLVNSANVQQSIADIFVSFGGTGGTTTSDAQTAEESARFIADVGTKLVI